MSRLSELLAAVHANPDDLEARLVYADALSEAGDPRGEFIVRQCDEGAPVSASHLPASWLGPLAMILDPEISSFWRGFLDSASLKANLNPGDLAALAGDPHWATVRSLSLDHTEDPDVRQEALAILVHPVMRALGWLNRIDSRLLVSLCEHHEPLPIRSIFAATAPLFVRDFDPSRPAFENPRGLPMLRRLWLMKDGYGLEDVEWLLRCTLVGRLERLTLTNFDGNLDDWRDLARRAHPRLGCLALRGDVMARFRRGEDGYLSEIEVGQER
jgi:uncharacterized protein (TIGR02996 family)